MCNGNVVEKEGQVAEQQEKLSSAISELSGLVAGLETKLEPIILKHPPEEKGKTQPDENLIVPLAKEIREQAFEVRKQNYRLQDLIDSIEL